MFIMYGAGYEAERFYYGFEERDEVRYVIDRSAEGDFHGLRIVKPHQLEYLEDSLILVATNWENYCQIRDELKKQGLEEFHHFIPARAYGKKIAVIHANCYENAYYKYLSQSRDFNNRYFLYRIPQVHNNHDKVLDDNLLQNCDLYLHQDIRLKNRVSELLSDDYILPRLKETCEAITIPNLVGYGKWECPRNFITKRKEKDGSNCEDFSLFEGNRIIDHCYLAGYSLEEIKKVFMDADILSGEEQEMVRETFQERMSSLREREKKWDIKISDYILDTYKTQKLFTDDSHPSKPLLNEILRRLGKRLGLTDYDEIEVDVEYTCIEWFVMPCVKKALGLQFEEKYVREKDGGKNKLKDGPMDVDEYIREYVFWKFDKMI